jgi:hypothetical protein
MAYYNLNQTGGTNIHTDFRFELEVVDDTNNSKLGLNDKITAFITKCDVPSAPGNGIPWYMPGGMRNWQAGKRQTKDINLEFVVSSDLSQSWYRTLEKWGDACYDLNTGNNAGKAGYSTDAISIRIKGEDGKTRYRFRLLRAQITKQEYGELNSEGETGNLIKVKCTIIYDNYEIYDGNNTLIQASSNL